ncbi:MAG: PAS domain S-box protein [Woeseiaceae bacterium]
MIDFIYQYEASIRLAVFLGGFSLLALWEGLIPKRELTQVKFKRWFNNIALVATSTVLVRIIMPTAAIGIAYLVEQNQWGIANAIALPFWLKVLFTFLLLDLTLYFQHAIFHVMPILWRFHRVHHSDLDCDITTGLRFHPVEILISTLIKFIAIFTLGAPVLAVILFELVLNLMPMFTHSNIRLNTLFERVLRWFIVTPDMHRIHHSIVENETNSNFSFNTSLWDRIFGTYLAQAKAGQKGIIIGLEQFRAPNWQNFKGLIAMPFTSTIKGYAINARDTINTDKFTTINELVTEQTKALKQVKESTEAKNKVLKNTISRLTESENYQSTIIENMIDGFISINTKGIINTFNPAAEKIFGYKADEVIGKNIAVLMSESEAIHHDTHLAHYKEYNEHHTIGISRNIKGQRKDGSLFPLDIALSEVHTKGKQVFTAIVRDISERKEAEEKILSEKLIAEKANRVKTEFLSSMSHELRTPLNAIIGFSDLLSFQEGIDPQLQKQISIIHNAGHELLDKVINVLSLSQLEEGKVKVIVENFLLSELLDECISLIKPLSKKHEVQLNLISNSNAETIRTDRNQLKQVLLNLLSNAVKFISEGEKVTLETIDYNDEGLRIIVSDNGPGIDQKLIKNIFEPFNRLGQENSAIPGTGIGLVIAKQLTELMGGSIGIETKPGKGSKFWIDLPQARKVEQK